MSCASQELDGLDRANPSYMWTRFVVRGVIGGRDRLFEVTLMGVCVWEVDGMVIEAHA
jgi:hypothetical protein